MKKRIAWIDVAKGICILAVIAGHLGDTTANSIVYPFHLGVFFILSGYTLKAQLSADGIKRKFSSLIVPYLVTCLFVLLGDIYNLIFVHNDASLAGIASVVKSDMIRSFWASGAYTEFLSFDLGGRIGAIWFLPALFISTVTLQAVLVKIKKRHAYWAIALILSAAAFISAKYIWLPFSIQSGFYVMPFVLLGYEIKKSGIFEKVTKKKAAVLFLIGMAASVPIILSGKAMMSFAAATAPYFIISFVLSAVVSLTVIFLSMLIDRVKPLEFIGRNSLYVLCVHLFDLSVMGVHTVKVINQLGLEHTFAVKYISDLVWIAVMTAIVLGVKSVFSGIKKSKKPLA